MTIFLGPDNKSLGLSFHQIFTGVLPIAKGQFPLHVKEAVEANPGLENSFMAFEKFVAMRPHKKAVTLAPAPVSRKGTPIMARPGLKK